MNKYYEAQKLGNAEILKPYCHDLELLGKYAKPTIYFIYNEQDIKIHTKPTLPK